MTAKERTGKAASVRGPERVFLGWSHPAVESAVAYLQKFVPTPEQVGKVWDLSGYVIVLPTGWAVRRLLARLADLANEKRLTLLPPEVVTIGQLPEQLYAPTRPIANEPTCLLAWCVALRQLFYDDPEALKRLFPHWKPSEGGARWLGVAQSLARLRHELSSHGLGCATVCEKIRQMNPRFSDLPRWETLAALERRYQAILEGAGVCDLAQARQEALVSDSCRTDRRILLVGLVDLPPIVRTMLDRVREHLSVLIVAPQEFANRFDTFGCLIPEHWQEIPVEIPDDRVAICQQAGDQAEAVIEFLARLPPEFGVEDVTIGAADESLVPLILESLQRYQIPGRYGAGRSVLRSPVWLLLQALVTFTRDKSAEAFAALIRHPAVERWIATRMSGPMDLLTTVDEWIISRLPLLMDAEHMASESGPVKEIWELLWKHFQLDRWDDPQSITDCAESIRKVLVAFFGDVVGAWSESGEDSAQAELRKACQAVMDALGEWLVVPCGFQSELGWQVTPNELVNWLRHHLAARRIPAPLLGPSVEIMGWLDVPWDDAPVTIVTTVNEGFVPSIISYDAFLTPQLRRWLLLDDGPRRLARDAYALSLIVASRREWYLVVGRQNTAGDPLLPSRFVFSRDARRLPHQVQKFFGREADQVRRRPPRWSKAAKDPQCLGLPAPDLLVEWTEIRVTQFRDYLLCPYRFYLRHVLQLGTLSDDVEELDPLSFGNLAHEVLCEFARSKLRNSTDADEIAEFLVRKLEEQVQRRLARLSKPAVHVQIEQLKDRLRAFAEFQARHAQEWEILHAEYSPPKPVNFKVDGVPIRLIGRIDRIDRRRDAEEYLIADYKVTEQALTPEQAHRRTTEGQKTWIDLQLPLYRHLAAGVVKNRPVRLGFIVLPKETERTAWLPAEWGEEELAQADEAARDVVRRIRRGDFWPPREDAEGKFPDLAPILP